MKEYRESDRAKEGRKRRYIKNKLSMVMSSAILRSLKGAKEHRPWQDFVEYNTNELILHLQKTIGLTSKVILEDFWECFHGTEYHIDHIIPLSSAKDAKSMLKLWHYTNLQWLLAVDNIEKSDKLNWALKGE
jgi:hypothetical protein